MNSFIFSLIRTILQAKSKIKVDVSHSLIAVGAMGVRIPLYLGHN